MTIIEAQKLGAEKLTRASIPSAILDAEVLLMLVLKKSKEYIFTNPEINITKTQENKYKSLIKRRAKFEPIAYLIGKKEFYGLSFMVNKNVLIPRPETELLIEEVIKYVGKNKYYIVDVGTGSGAIAITLKKYLPQIEVAATDISNLALRVAQKNAQLNKVDIKFITTDLISKISDKIEIVVANLPYVPDSEKRIKNVFSAPLKYEPAKALYAGRYGLDIYEKLFKQVNKLEIKPKALFCEIGSTYINKTMALVKKYFPQAKVEIKKDLCGKDRLLIIELNKLL